MADWYDQIEPGVRPLVKLLRDNGVNTTSSCEGHAAKGLEVEADLMLDGEIQRIHSLLYNNGYRNYTITVEVKVREGRPYSWLIISVEKGGSTEGKP